MNTKTIYFLALIFLVAMASCNKEDDHPVPYVRVDFEFNVIHYNLAAPGMADQFPRETAGGYRGIFVYRLSQDEFRAFDRASPENPHVCTLSILEENALLAGADCSESVYFLPDGSPVEGPSNYPLREYRTSFNPTTNRLRVVN